MPRAGLQWAPALEPLPDQPQPAAPVPPATFNERWPKVHMPLPVKTVRIVGVESPTRVIGTIITYVAGIMAGVLIIVGLLWPTPIWKVLSSKKGVV